MTALERLAAAIEAGNAQTHHFAQAFPSESAMGHCTWHDAQKAYNDDMNAARALQDAVLPGVPWEIWMVTLFDTNPKEYGCNLPGIETAYSFMPARSWLLAQVRALIAKEGKE